MNARAEREFDVGAWGRLKLLSCRGIVDNSFFLFLVKMVQSLSVLSEFKTAPWW